MKEEPPLGAKCKDKFLIQSTLITPEKETLPLQDIVCPTYSTFEVRLYLFTVGWRGRRRCHSFSEDGTSAIAERDGEEVALFIVVGAWKDVSGAT